MVHRMVVDAHVIMVRGGRVLLSRRRGSFGDGLWHLPSGKVDAGESLVQAAVREAREEVGVRIDENDLRQNREPEKCYELGWFALDALPGDIIGYPASGLRGHLESRSFGTLGWEG
ncbi:NUDIX domain-containing protein [Saccharopolyspora karakumensis]|uniref:NUDIX domain-containing protein n=2 Tax=Saccharopolyspora karakumensis TaxID=2530386 RepID=A0A4R5BLW0_9PSEU|nr:NUDIX domain-containing protein [Saccharopolyspora karakumensis]